MTRRVFIALLVVSGAFLVTGVSVFGQEGLATPSPAASLTGDGDNANPTTVAPAVTPIPTDPPLATVEPTFTPFPCESLPPPTPVASTSTDISSRLVVDTNGNGVVDDSDGPGQTLVELAIWAHAEPNTALFTSKGSCARARGEEPAQLALQMLTDANGHFTFSNVPAGDYTVWVWWIGGFQQGSTESVPDLLRAAVRVNKDGTVGVPEPLPDSWPEGFGSERLDVARDHVILGELPPVILLKQKPPNVFPYPLSSNTLVLGEGALNVGSLLEGDFASLPAVGSGSESRSGSHLVMAWVALAALVLAGVGVAVRSRIRSRS